MGHAPRRNERGASKVAAAACASAVVASACAGGGLGRGAGSNELGDLGTRGRLRGDATQVASLARAALDPTVVGARIVPEAIDDSRAYGVEPGGGVRGIAAGVRVVSLPFGAMLAASDRLPQAPSATASLPERLGGGFLFVLGPTVWRSAQWLAPIRPVFTSAGVISRVIVGLDRVYIRAPNGSHQAIDPRTGARLDMGPWPGSSSVGGFAAADGWRAIAINDLRGVVATFDAGATWKPLGLPVDAKVVALAGDLLVVSGDDATHASVAYEVRADGQVGRATSDVVEGGPAMASSGSSPPASAASLDGLRTFGKRPLVAALEDGLSLGDGTAVVARDGALGRVRLDDGALVDVAREAYALKPSRCHALRMDAALPARAHAGVSPFGFVCGEPRGKTVLYAYDAASGAMVDVKQWATPRAVLAAGNGAVAVRGPCAEGAVVGEAEGASERAYCVRAPVAAGATSEPTWRDVRVRGTNGSERVVPLADGRVAVITPPEGALATARVTILDRGAAQTKPLVFPAFAGDAEIARAMRTGAWLDGFEERRPGVLGGWVEANGTFVGLEVDVDGAVRVGKLVRDLGTPMVSGRYGLGWSASRRGYETTDGGMTWTLLDVPEPIVPPRQVPSRACGPLGCTAAGWLRVGWGDDKRAPLPDAPAPMRTAAVAAAPLELTCDASPAPRAPPPATRGAASSATLAPNTFMRLAVTAPAQMQPGAALFGAFVTPPQGDLSPFYSAASPTVRADDVALTAEALDILARAPRTGPLARLYAWGPKTTDWDKSSHSHWLARWVFPYADSNDVHSTASSAAPFATLEAARRTLGAPSVPASFAGTSAFWTVALGDDAQHALLLGRRNSPVESTVLLLEDGRPIVEARLRDHEPFGDIEAATRVGHRWYLATSQAAGELPATVVWQIDGTTGRELTRVTRSIGDARPFATQLARRADGRSIALVVEGQPLDGHYLPARWALPIDVETGAQGDPELLGTTDMSDRPPVALCSGDESGWVLDASWSGAPVRINGSVALQSLMVRLRLRGDGGCIEAVSGSLDLAQLARAEGERTAHGSGDRRSVTRRETDSTPAAPVAVFAGRARRTLRCLGR